MATKVKFTLTIPEELHDLYSSEAKKHNRSVEQEIIHRLEQCQTFNALQPLYFNDDQRAKLQQALGHVLTGPDDVLAKLSRVCDLQVGEVHVPLSPQLQLRMKTRVPRGETPEGFIVKKTQEHWERETGLRPW